MLPASAPVTFHVLATFWPTSVSLPVPPTRLSMPVKPPVPVAVPAAAPVSVTTTSPL